MTIPAFLPDDRVQLAPGAFDGALAELRALLGDDRVLIEGEEFSEYRDPFQPADWDVFQTSAVVFPDTVTQVQEIVRIATTHAVPLWTQGQGRNNGYGGAAPRVSGGITLNLRRMNRVLEINDELCYAVVEPGVSFQDLYDELEKRGSRLMVSVPDLGWGSLIGNSLDNGMTYLPYGRDFQALCGLEVVTAEGELLRTNLGAMDDNESWHLYRRGFGPSLDQLFTQSNLGIVVKAGIWLMPKPEVIGFVHVDAFKDEGIGPLVDTLRELRLDGTVDGVPCIMNTLLLAATVGPRSMWYDGDPSVPIPDEGIDAIAEKMGIGRWHVRIALYGDRPIVDYRIAKITREFEKIPDVRVVSYVTDPDEAKELPNPSDRVYAAVPNLDWKDMGAWYGGERGGHMAFAPVVPLTGEKVAWLQDWLRKGFAEEGLDFTSDIIVSNDRSAAAVAGLNFAFDDPEDSVRAYRVVRKLVAEAAKLGYGEYRAHLHLMDLVQDQYAFNDHAYRRFVEKIKDAVDPHGILSPGKQGIWPRAYREQAR